MRFIVTRTPQTLPCHQCDRGMGKQWVRGTAKQEPAVPQAPKAKRKLNVWTRDSFDKSQAARPTQQSQAGPSWESIISPGSASSQPGTETRQASSEASEQLGDSAKRRRLAAKGRLEESGLSRAAPSQNGARTAEERLAEDKQRDRQREEAEKQKQLQDEADTLRKKIAEEEHKVLVAKAAARRREAEKLAAEKAKQEERERRKQRLDAGFAEAFKLTRELNARPDAPKVSAASNAEVERVLAAKTDLDVMQIKPGSSTAVIKKRYRAMTLALHPDKCKADKATDAFQRMVHAYQRLLELAQ